MANVLTLNGYFGVKQSFHISDPDITTGWTEGQLFVIESIGTSGADTLKGATPSKGPFVGLNAASGGAISGVALEGSDEESTAVAGMSHPSGSKVTLLHGHSSFFIVYQGTEKTGTSRARTLDGAPWEADLEAGSLMDPLYASANGKFSAFGGLSTFGVNHIIIGHMTQVPAAANSWTIGVVLYG